MLVSLPTIPRIDDPTLYLVGNVAWVLGLQVRNFGMFYLNLLVVSSIYFSVGTLP